MNVFGIGLPEMAVIAVIGLLVFGPKRLPELGKTLGRTLRGFQSASQEFEREFRSAIAVEGDGDRSVSPSLTEGTDPALIATEATAVASVAAAETTVDSTAQPAASDSEAPADALASTPASGGAQA